MINREIKPVIYREYDNTKDAYGQVKRQSADFNLEMVIKTLGQQTVEDPRFIDCDALGITKATNIKVGNLIIDGDKKYLIKYLIPSHRYQQVFLKCEK